MFHIYWNKKKVPIPKEAYINHNDGRVFVIIDGHRKVIGTATNGCRIMVQRILSLSR